MNTGPGHGHGWHYRMNNPTSVGTCILNGVNYLRYTFEFFNWWMGLTASCWCTFNCLKSEKTMTLNILSCIFTNNSKYSFGLLFMIAYTGCTITCHSPSQMIPNWDLLLSTSRLLSSPDVHRQGMSSLHSVPIALGWDDIPTCWDSVGNTPPRLGP